AARGINAVGESYDCAPSMNILARRITKNFLRDFHKRIVVRRAVACAHLFKRRLQSVAVARQSRQNINRRKAVCVVRSAIESYDCDAVAWAQRVYESARCAANQSKFVAR